MNRKTVSVLLLAALIVPAVFAAESDAEASETYYSQLDANGKGLYDRMIQIFDESMVDPVDSVSISFTVVQPMLFDSIEKAQEYGDSFVRGALVAAYLSNPYPIWIWDVPMILDSLDVSKIIAPLSVGGTTWQTIESVTFSLSVPDGFASGEGEDNGILSKLDEISSKTISQQGTDSEKIEAINEVLRKVSIKNDPEGQISNIYDALVTGRSSSAGIAAAFTYLCGVNGVDSYTVMGDIQTNDGYAVGYWNQSMVEGTVYATDCTWNKSSEYGCLLVGYSTSVENSLISGRFNSTHVVDNGIMGTSLIPAQIAEKGVDWSYRDSLLDKYGNSIMMVILGVIIVAALLYAIRTKNF